MTKISLKIGLICASALLLSAPASAQSVADMSQRMQTLENEVQTLNRAFYAGQTSLGSLQASADAQAQMQQLESEMRKLQGQIEEASHETRMMRRELDTLNETLSVRFDEIEKRLKAAEEEPVASSQAVQQPQASAAPVQIQTPPSAVPSQAPASVLETPTQQPFLPPVDQGPKAAALSEYEAAFTLLKGAKYNQAQLGFETFLEKHPQHQLASNAKYWLGETYYVREDYSQSARIFAEGFQAYPKGAKAPDNLLKLGLSLDALGKKEDACVALKQVEKEFPTGANAVTSRAMKELERIGCE